MPYFIKLYLAVGTVYLLVYSPLTFAQTNDVKAQSAFINAQSAFEQGSFTTSVDYLKQARDLLGSTNTKIQYLLVRALIEAKDYVAADTELKHYFEVTPEIARDARYDEMVKNVAFVEKMRKEKEEELKQQKKKDLIQARDDSVFRQNTISKLHLNIRDNRRRATGKTLKGLVAMPISLGILTYALIDAINVRNGNINNYSTDDPDTHALVDSGLLTGSFFAIPGSIRSFVNAHKLRKEARSFQNQVDVLEKQVNRKQVSLFPIYTPQSQFIGLSARMRF